MSLPRADLVRPPGSTVVRFQLTDGLTAYGSGNAKLLTWNPLTELLEQSEGSFTVYDVAGFHATGTKKGYAVFMPDASRWEVIHVECPEA